MKILVSILIAALIALSGFLIAAPQGSQFQSQEDADRKSTGCKSCHGATEAASMHTSTAVHLGCADCHGGNVNIQRPAGEDMATYRRAVKQAHPQPKLADLWKNSANPVRAATSWLKEDKDYIKFVNPGDLRIAGETCGQAGCHAKEVNAVRTGMMTHGGMLWSAALYNNGAVPFKDARYGESYSAEGIAQSLRAYPPPTQE